MKIRNDICESIFMNVSVFRNVRLFCTHEYLLEMVIVRVFSWMWEYFHECEFYTYKYLLEMVIVRVFLWMWVFYECESIYACECIFMNMGVFV